MCLQMWQLVWTRQWAASYLEGKDSKGFLKNGWIAIRSDGWIANLVFGFKLRMAG